MTGNPPYTPPVRRGIRGPKEYYLNQGKWSATVHYEGTELRIDSITGDFSEYGGIKKAAKRLKTEPLNIACKANGKVLTIDKDSLTAFAHWCAPNVPVPTNLHVTLKELVHMQRKHDRMPEREEKDDPTPLLNAKDAQVESVKPQRPPVQTFLNFD